MHYVIIGNGVAGITAAFTLRKRDARAQITVISAESDYFFSRTALMYAYMDRMNRRDLEPYERKVYTAQRIELRRDFVTSLDAARHVLKLRGGTEMSYDRLLIATGSVPAQFAWPGLAAAKEGVTHFVSLQDLEACERLTPSTRKAVVVGGGLIGVELVECLVHHGVQVDFLVRESWYWPMALGEEEGNLVADHIRKHGVNLRLGDQLAEVLTDGNGRVSGVRTAGGVSIDCQMLGVCIGVRPAIEWLRSSASMPELGRGIRVDAGFRTSLPDVWAAGDCAEFDFAGHTLVEQIWYSAKRHGELAALSMLGDKVAYEPPLFYNSAKFFEIEYTTVGKVLLPPPDDAQSFSYSDPKHEMALRIVERDGAVTGFNMLGSRWDHTALERWIHERRSMDEVVSNLRTAQFDVEFGRMPLDGVRAAYQQWRRRVKASAA